MSLAIGPDERYTSGLHGLLALEEQHRGLVPEMFGYASSERLRSYLEDQLPLINRQARRLGLLLRGLPGTENDVRAERGGLERNFEDLSRTRDADDRDAELFEASLWIANLKIEQYVDTRDHAIRLGYLEHYRHLQRSVNAVLASTLRLRNIADRVTCMISGFGVPDVGWDLRQRMVLP